jgi:hypothetical protein
MQSRSPPFPSHALTWGGREMRGAVPGGSGESREHGGDGGWGGRSVR